ncbi:MAG TPA: hypothetical protein VJ904_12740 [Tichowtungia sp.]|nr:hypothetical protein [Tichowtungia sp.]
MKLLQSILIMILFCSMSAPCVHGEVHGHHEPEEGVALSGAAHCIGCHVNAEEPCSKPQQAVTSIAGSALIIPEQRVPLRTVPEPKETVPVVSTVPTLHLRLLQTVHLLI